MNITKLTELIGSGAEADVYRYDKYAIKLFKEHCPKQEAFYEASVHTIIEWTNLPIPKVYEVSKINDRWAIIMDFVSGTTMKDIIFADIENINFHIDCAVDMQLKVQQNEGTGLKKLNDRLSAQISKAALLSSNQKQALINKLNSFAVENKLCHGDFHFLNLIKTDNEIMIIDWIDAASGNPEADACRSYMLYLLYANDIAGLYLDAYCKKANKSREAITKWLPVIAGARLSENKANELELLLKLISEAV